MDEAIAILRQVTADQAALVQDPRRQQTSPAGMVHQRFFGHAPVTWLRPLHAAGFFTTPPWPQPDEREGGVFLPAWPESRYLARVAAENPDATVAASLSVPDTDNSRVVWDLVEVGLAVPPDLAARLAAKLTRLIPGPYGAVAADRVGKLAAYLADAGHPAPALSLVRTLLRQVPTGNHGPVRRYEYVRILRESMPAVTAAVGLPALALLVQTLDAATAHEQAKSRTGLFDQSPHWRPAIEVDQRSRRDDPRSALVDAIRAAAGHLICEHTVPVDAVIAELADRTQLIFRRLRLHLLAEHGAASPRLVGRYLTDATVISDPAAEREVIQLIAAGNTWLDAAERRRMLALIERGPDLDVWSRLHKSRWNQEPDDGAFGEFADRWRRNRLHAAGPILTNKSRRVYQELLAIYGPAPDWDVPPEPQFEARPDDDPPVGADLATMTTSDLADLLRATPSPGPDSATTAVTADAVHAAVEQDAWLRSTEARLFIGVAPDKTTAVIDGFTVAARAGTSLDWHGLLPLLVWVNEQADAELGHGFVDNRDRRWREARLSMLTLLGLDSTDPQRIPAEAEPTIWSIIAGACADPDPQHGDETGWSDADPVTYASHTVRTSAIRAVVVYGLRAQQRDPRADLTPVLTLLDKHVELAADPALAVRAIYGDLLHVLARLDSRWVQQRLSQILPSDPEQRAASTVAWDAHLHRQATDAAWPLLRPYYLRNIERLDRTATTDLAVERARLLANHLGNRYWFGHLSLDDDDQLLQHFYDRCPPEASAIIIEAAGNTLLKSAIDDTRRNQLMRLWHYRVDAARQGADPHELAHFDTWFISGSLPDGWALEQLRVALELVDTMSLDAPVLRRVTDLAPNHPHACLNVLAQWSTNYVDDFRFDRDGQLEQIISIAGAVDDAAAALAHIVVDRLALRGMDLRQALATL